MSKTSRLICFLSLLVHMITGCGSSIEEIEVGQLECDMDNCEVDFGRLSNRGSSVAKARVSNEGKGDLGITRIYLEDSSPLMAFSGQTILDIARRNNRWQYKLDTQEFDTAGTDLVLGSNAVIELELEIQPEDGQSLCPGAVTSGGTQPCGFLVVEGNASDANGRSLRIPISLIVGNGLMAVSPSTISFGPPVVGQEQVREFTISNTGTGQLLVQGIQLNDSKGLRWKAQSNQGLPLAIQASESADFQVFWVPTNADELTDNMVIRSDAATGGTITVLLNSGSGSSGNVTIEPCSISLPEAAVGETAEALFTITNPTEVPMNWSVSMSQVIPSGVRSELAILDQNNDPAEGSQDALNAGQSATLKLIYTPTVLQAVSGELTFRGNFDTRRCGFTAGPAAPRIEANPKQLFWGNLGFGESDTRSFVIRNTGRAPLDVTSIDEGTDSSGEFSIPEIDAAGFTLDPGAAREIVVTYTRAESDVAQLDQTSYVINSNGSLTVVEIRVFAPHGDNLVAPTCVATVTPNPGSVGSSLNLSGTDSTLNSGEWSLNRFEWSVIPPAGSTATFTNAVFETGTFVPDIAGEYEFLMLGTSQVDTQKVSCQTSQVVTVE